MHINIVILTLAAVGNLPLVIVYPLANNSKSNKKQVSDAPIKSEPKYKAS